VSEPIQKQPRFCPIPPPHIRALRLANGRYRINECGDLEKPCGACHEWWPADTEFYFGERNAPDGLSSACRACYLLRRYPERFPEVMGVAA